MGQLPWEVHQIKVTSADAPNCGTDDAHPFTANFRCIDMLSWVKFEYSNLDCKGNFVTEAARVHAVNGDR
jgi:hypothetical protein